MKIVLMVLFGFSLWSHESLAARITKPILIQCSFEGPILRGTIQYESEMRNWSQRMHFTPGETIGNCRGSLSSTVSFIIEGNAYRNAEVGTKYANGQAKAPDEGGYYCPPLGPEAIYFPYDDQIPNGEAVSQDSGFKIQFRFDFKKVAGPLSIESGRVSNCSFATVE